MYSLFITVALSFSALSWVNAENVDALKAVTESTNEFSTNLFKNLAHSKKENFVCSPLSAHMVLSMAAYGAGGNTAVQMRQSLHLPSDDVSARQGFENLIDHLNKVENVTLEVANKIYVGDKLKLKPAFKELTSLSFRSEASELDFAQTDKAVKTINDWAKEKTHDKIPEIVTKDSITSDTRMVLLNAVYFKGNWAKEFKKKDTTDRPFHLDEKTQKNVPTMFLKSKFVYGELPDLKAKFIELPYQNKDLKMVIIVPDEITGLSKIEENIEKFNYTTLLEAGYEREVFLYLPKFKVESSIELNKPLEELGMSDMLSSKANFTGISDEPLKVSKVLQKAFIEVNEEGSEAAAVTEVEIDLRIGDLIEDVLVDRPSVFLINFKNVSIFSGRIMDPSR